MAFCFGGSVPEAWAADAKEYQVKAAFIYNFVKFVEWPGDKAVAKQNAIHICVQGPNPFTGAALDVFKQASTAQLKLVVTGWKGNAADCHILFIGASEAATAADTLAAVKNEPVLTVSEVPDFAKNGGAVEFTTQDNKVKLIVNTGAASAAGLRVDAQLLEIALKVIRG